MALVLDVDTPNGLLSYHTIAQQVFDDVKREAWCVLISYESEEARRAESWSLPTERMRTRFDLPQYVDPPKADALDSVRSTFYDFIVKQADWVKAQSDVVPDEPSPDDAVDVISAQEAVSADKVI